MIENNADILLISETKLDDSFPSDQFKICGFKMPYRYARNSMGGRLLLYIRDNSSTKLLKHNLENIFKIGNILKISDFHLGAIHKVRTL